MSQFCTTFHYSKRKESLISISLETYLTSRFRMKIIIGIQSQPILTAHPEHTAFLCNSIFHSWIAQLMKKWTQKIGAEQILLSQIHKNPPGKQRLFFFIEVIYQDRNSQCWACRCQFIDLFTDSSKLLKFLSVLLS